MWSGNSLWGFWLFSLLFFSLSLDHFTGYWWRAACDGYAGCVLNNSIWCISHQPCQLLLSALWTGKTLQIFCMMYKVCFCLISLGPHAHFNLHFCCLPDGQILLGLFPTFALRPCMSGRAKRQDSSPSPDATPQVQECISPVPPSLTKKSEAKCVRDRGWWFGGWFQDRVPFPGRAEGQGKGRAVCIDDRALDSVIPPTWGKRVLGLVSVLAQL